MGHIRKLPRISSSPLLPISVQATLREFWAFWFTVLAFGFKQRCCVPPCIASPCVAEFHFYSQFKAKGLFYFLSNFPQISTVSQWGASLGHAANESLYTQTCELLGKVFVWTYMRVSDWAGPWKDLIIRGLVHTMRTKLQFSMDTTEWLGRINLGKCWATDHTPFLP